MGFLFALARVRRERKPVRRVPRRDSLRCRRVGRSSTEPGGPGSRGEPVPDLGQRAFIGVATQGQETHVGGGALDGDRIVTVTLQGNDGTTENRARVVALIRNQAAVERAVAAPLRTTAVDRGCSPRSRAAPRRLSGL